MARRAREGRPAAYKGGFVRTPKIGIHKNIIVLDFKSLYPSIIVTHNIDVSTFNCGHKECKKNKVPGFDRYFCTKEEGPIPKRVKKLLQDREDIKKQLKQKSLSAKEREKLQKKEKQVKLAANITYGYFGYTGSPYYNVKVAESISAFGRYYIQSTIKKAEEAGFSVIYGDTDSVFLQGNQGKAKKFLDKINKWFPGIIKLEWRGVYKRGLFVARKGGEGAKKKYALMDSKGDLLVRGFEVRRGDWCELAKNTQEKILKLILSEKSKEAIDYARSVVKDLKKRKFDIKNLVISEQLTKPLEKYKAIGPHTMAAKKMKELGYEIPEGTMIKYIIVKGKGSISERAEPVGEVKKEDVDVDYYIEHQIIPAAIRVLSIFDVKEEDLLNN